MVRNEPQETPREEVATGLQEAKRRNEQRCVLSPQSLYIKPPKWQKSLEAFLGVGDRVLWSSLTARTCFPRRVWAGVSFVTFR